MARLKIIYILVITLLGMLFLYRDSINLYWTQTYHTDSPLVAVERQIHYWFSPVEMHPAETVIVNQSDQKSIQEGTQKETQEIEVDQNLIEAVVEADNDAQIVMDLTIVEREDAMTQSQSASNVVSDTIESSLQSSEFTNDILLMDRNDLPADLIVNEGGHGETQLVDSIEIPTLELGSIAGFNAETEQFVGPILPQLPWDVILESGDKIFFVGDSLMQGVAPRVRQTLYKEHNIDGVDLSKQSTGLAYPNFYNWPKVAEETLQQDSKIKAIVVYLGPNDPWDFPIPGRKKYLKFKSPEWERAYRGRIRNILLSAHQYNLPVIWLGAPCMRKDKLHKDMVYLNSLYQEEVSRFNGHYIPTSGILGCSDAGYEAYAQTAKGNQKVRTNDGIHFTVTGQRLLADRIIEELIILPDATEALLIESEPAPEPESESVVKPESDSSNLITELRPELLSKPIHLLDDATITAPAIDDALDTISSDSTPLDSLDEMREITTEVMPKENPLKANQVPLRELLLIE